MILAGDVGGTKCNLALFSERNGKLEFIFRQRFASKDFSKFELIVKEFTDRLLPTWAIQKFLLPGSGLPGRSSTTAFTPRICRGLSMRTRYRKN